MGLYYPNTKIQTLIGSKSGTTRTAVTLTAAYDVADKTISLPVGGYSKVNLSMLYTMGSGESSNSVNIRIENSPDGINWYRFANESVSTGTSTLSAREFTFVGNDATTATIGIGLDIFYKHIKISAKETGTITNFGTLFIEGTLAGK